jgi:hypothetical protein
MPRENLSPDVGVIEKQHDGAAVAASRDPGGRNLRELARGTGSPSSSI